MRFTSVGASGESDARSMRPTRSQDGATKGKDSWRRWRGQALRLGAILAILAVINLATGAVWWVQWPALGMALYLAFRAVPLIGRD